MSELPLTFFDIGVIVVVLLSAVLSLARGGMRELFNLASWVGAIAVAITTFHRFRPMVLDAVGNDLIADVGTGALVFFVPLVVFMVIGRAIASAMSGGAFGPVDRLLGLAFGVARGALIVCAAYLVTAQIIPREELPDWVQTAYLKEPVENGADLLAEYMPDDVMARSQDLLIDRLDGSAEAPNTEAEPNTR